MPVDEEPMARGEAAAPASAAAEAESSAAQKSDGATSPGSWSARTRGSAPGTAGGIDSGAVYTAFERAERRAGRGDSDLLRLAQEPRRPRHHPAARPRGAADAGTVPAGVRTRSLIFRGDAPRFREFGERSPLVA